jgi:hypothetical protein
MKTLLILAAVLMMQGCVTSHNEKFSGAGVISSVDLTKKNDAAGKQQAQEWAAWCKANPVACQKSLDDARELDNALDIK